MKISEIIQKIECGEIVVDFGRLFLDFKKPLEYLVADLKILSERINKVSSEKYKNILGDREYSDIEIEENGLMSYGLLNDIKLHSFLMNEDYYLHFKDNKITFKDVDYGPLFTKIAKDPVVEEGIELPLVTKISIPSGKILFHNYFPNSVSPEMENRWSNENSLNGMRGRRNHARHYEKHGVLFGQTGNTNLNVWINQAKDCILITEVSLDNIRKKSNKLLKYINDNKFKIVDKVCCEVWRFEATDCDRFNEITGYKANGIKVKGKEAIMTHYLDSLTKSDISDLIVSKIDIIS